MTDDMTSLTATQLAKKSPDCRAAPGEAVRAALDRIDRFNPAVKAYVHVDHAGAKEAANASDRRWADPKIGADALSLDPQAALDLPAKVLIRDGGDGTEIIYAPPAEMVAEWAIPPDGPLIAETEETLRGITTGAAE